MRRLRIIAFGTADFLERYSGGLQEDCKKFGYECVLTTIPKETEIGRINQHVFDGIIEHMRTQQYDRLCLLDPECRIIKPIPEVWINSLQPVIFRKVRNEEGTPDKKFVYSPDQNTMGNKLPCRIICQPMFLNKADQMWLTFARDLSISASDVPNGEYVRNELFLETAIDFLKVKTIDEFCVYNRKANIPHKAVKGTWSTEDTVIPHPELHSVFDTDMVTYTPVRNKLILEKTYMENNTNDLDTLEKINEVMWKEKTDEWLTFEQWHVQPSTGSVRYGDYNRVMYHYTIRDKMDKGIQTPAVKNYKLVLTKFTN